MNDDRVNGPYRANGGYFRNCGCSLSTPYCNPTLTLYLPIILNRENFQDTAFNIQIIEKPGSGSGTAEDGTADCILRIGCLRKVLYAQLSYLLS